MSPSFSYVELGRISCAVFILASTTDFAHSQQAVSLNTPTPLPSYLNLPNVYFRAEAVSGSGKIIAGSLSYQGKVQLIYWSSDNRSPELTGSLSGYKNTNLFDMSADGKVIVGGVDTPSAPHAFRWHRGTMQVLGLLPGGDFSIATGTNATGDVVVGTGGISGGYTRAFRWQDGLMHELSILPGAISSGASAISSDGKVIVGSLEKPGLVSRAVVWKDDQILELSPLAGHINSSAYNTNVDGSVVVGWSQTGAGTGPVTAVRWQNNTIQDLGALNAGDDAYATSVSDDGTIVVGQSVTDTLFGSRYSAFRWENGQMENIGGLTGAVDTLVGDISADGSTIVGVSGFGTYSRAFIYRTAIQDLANVQASAVEVADEFANAVDLNGRLARDLREVECHISSGYNACLGVRSGVTSLFQGTNAFGGSVTGAVQIGSELKLGASVGAYGEGNAGSTLDLSYGVGIGAFAEYLIDTLPFSSSETQFRARLDGAWLYSDADVTRGQDYTDVQTGKGSTSFNSGTVGAKLIADHQFSETLVISPYMGAYWESTYQAGYDEQTELDTIANIHGGSTSAVAGVFGVRSRFSASEQLELSFGLQGEVDFFADDVEVSASTNIPGLADFSVSTDRSRSNVRFTAEAGAAYNLTEKSRVEMSGKVFSSRYQDKLGGDLALRFSSSF